MSDLIILNIPLYELMAKINSYNKLCFIKSKIIRIYSNNFTIIII